MVLLSTFLFNLLCALVPCDPIRSSPTARLDQIKLREDVRKYGENVSHPVIQTESGPLQGFPMGSRIGRRFYAFEGIKYGEAPVGSRRFKPPVPGKPWKKVYKAFQKGSDCLQLNPAKLFRIVGHEDCLFLNIYSPLEGRNSSAEKLETLIWIHGGSYVFGAGGDFGPAYLLDNDVILVTINYRLGVLGFMSTGDDASFGNYGLFDQQLAMKWIYDNIENFGGSKNKIHLIGQSAGAVSLHLHMMNEESKKYFNSGISFSGTAFLFWGIQTPEKARDWTNKIAKYVKCPTDDSYKLTECLRRYNPYMLTGAQINIFDDPPIFPPVLFGPVYLTKNYSEKDSFINESPEEIYLNNKIGKKPWMSTVLGDEGRALIYAMNILLKTKKAQQKLKAQLPFLLSYVDFSEAEKERVSEEILKFYFKGKSPAKMSDEEFVSIFSNVASDRYFLYGCLKGIRAHSQIAPTYSYFFSYNSGKYNLGTLSGQTKDVWAPGHGEDQFYVFNSTLFMDGIKKEDKEYELSQIMINLIMNFIKKGEPLHTDKNHKLVNIWDKIRKDEEGFNMLKIDKDIQMIPFPYVERMKFWESLNIEDFHPLKNLNFTI